MIAVVEPSRRFDDWVLAILDLLEQEVGQQVLVTGIPEPKVRMSVDVGYVEWRHQRAVGNGRTPAGEQFGVVLGEEPRQGPVQPAPFGEKCQRVTGRPYRVLGWVGPHVSVGPVHNFVNKEVQVDVQDALHLVLLGHCHERFAWCPSRPLRQSPGP